MCLFIQVFFVLQKDTVREFLFEFFNILYNKIIIINLVFNINPFENTKILFFSTFTFKIQFKKYILNSFSAFCRSTEDSAKITQSSA